ncbi:MAG: GNVR domain-containing protein, partial [Eubacteriales bacterium]|nr:GNVR domain-containing protein [Eubacteriales bacterium]
IQIAVEDYDPETAKAIANKVAEVFQHQVADIMKVENVQIIDKAVLPVSPINAASGSNLVLSALAGLILGTALILLIDYLDRTVKTPQDVRKLVDLPVLGMIPVFEERKGLVK